MKAANSSQRSGRLVRVSDSSPGISRLRRGSGFVYRDARGRKLTNDAELRRIRSLAIPPAYTDVWICEQPNGHLQATGLDARGRKQYRYHPRWREQRDARKFDRLIAFGSALPRLRARVARDLVSIDGPDVMRAHVLATIVRLLDTTLARVGNDEYARENRSFGLTTLRTRHASVRGSRLRLRFKGKSGVLHDVAVEDKQVARIVRRCMNLPGEDLFQYVDDEGAPHAIASTDVNDYLREIAGTELSAKDFRTWHASVKAFDLARREPASGSSTRRARQRRVLAEVAARLGNTVAVCRKSYVHPAVLDLLTDAAALEEPAARRRRRLSRVECSFLAFLEKSAVLS
ncbi:MAG TPA: DNA topoisomerase IB [Burkholderiaceae bacterium]|nr:DNA topoisomerase IB [Burkholderiaceae bacterium]